jgi:endonuclease YncB( thermonuclease family)
LGAKYTLSPAHASPAFFPALARTDDMHPFALLMLVLSLCGLLCATPAEARVTHGKAKAVKSRVIAGTVVAVADGDTLTLVDKRGKRARRVIVRLAEIDAPEKCQPYGGQARKSLAELTLNRAVTGEIIDIDRYGRHVGRIRVDGAAETVNRIQLRRGLAWVYTQYSKDASLKTLERGAAASRLGLWADKKPVPPWQWRRKHPSRTKCPA